MQNTEYLEPSEIASLDRCLNEKDTSEFLGLKISALRKMCVHGDGPIILKGPGRRVRYRVRDLIQWNEQFLTSSTTDADTKV